MIMSRLSAAAALAACTAAIVVAEAQGAALRAGMSTGDASVVQTAEGPVRGVVSTDARGFMGIPFAAPPVGNLRWAPPAAVTPWSQPYDATKWSAGCPQDCDLPPGTCPPTQSEDCLYLNVYTPLPSGNDDGPLPVLLFIPGGRFMQGAAGMSLYDGREIAAKHGIVVVTINYRLGALGFLATGPETGNFGILDQRVAMQWVQRNIAAFGGNPDLVTLAGQSAGGVSVATHLVAPKSKGLFHRAIIESDPGSLRLKQASDQTVTANRFADAAGCGSASQMDCLRALSVDEVLSAQKASQGKLILDHILDVFLPWTPNVGGSEVPAEPLNGIDSGDWNAMPLMIGNTANDAWMFVMSAAKHLSPIEYRALALYLFGLKYEPDVLDRYPASSVFSSNDTRPELSILGTDYMFACPSRAIAVAAAKSNKGAYMFQTNHQLSFDAWGPTFEFCNDKGIVCHGTELPLLFGDSKPYSFTADEEMLHSVIMSYWASFIKTGSPGDASDTPQPVSWPQWTQTGGSADSGPTMLLDTGAGHKVVTGLRASNCDFWDSTGYNFG